MAPRLEHPRPSLPPRNRRTAAAPSRRQHASLPAPVQTDADPIGERTPLRDRGVALLAVFTAAMLVMVALAVVVGMHDSFWILVPVMAADLVLTAIVLVMVVKLLDEGQNE